MHCFISTRNGQVYFRTKLLRSGARAGAFCRCLAANKRFKQVSVVPSIQEGGGFFVQYQPSSQGRYSELYHDQYRQRELRGHAEQPGYTFEFMTNGRNAWYIVQTITGETYEVTESSCTCPDWQFRGKKSGLPCKHILAYSRSVALNEIRQLTLVRLDLRFGRTPTQQPVLPMPAPAA